MENRRFDLQFFAEGGSDPGTTGGGDPKPQDGPGGKTFTQEDLDRVVQERLDRERKKYADYEDLKKAKDELEKLKEGQMSELDKAKKALEEAQKAAAEKDAALKAMELRQLKAKLCAEAGLDGALADRVQGEDEAGIKKDLEALKKLIPPKPAGGAGAPPSADPGKTKSGDPLRDSIAAHYQKG